MNIGNIETPLGAAFAPMAGFTSAPVRAGAAAFGAAFTVSEMVSAKALTMQDKKTHRIMHRANGEEIYGIQLFGAEVDVMAQAAEIAAKHGADFIDINMGCPVPKVVKTGAGSALMRTPEVCGALVAAAKKGSALPVTVKIRRGIDGLENATEVAKACEAAGAAAVAVHARTREEMYTPGIHLETIAAVKQAVQIPVIGNGDIASAQDALNMLHATGCDMVMVGRAALGNPWLFAQIKAALLGEEIPTDMPLATRMDEMLREISGLCEEKGEDVGMREARALSMHFLRGVHGAAALRKLASGITVFADAQALAAEVLVQNPEM